MKASNKQLILILRNISSISGFITLGALLVMLTLIYLQKKIPLYYVSGGVFLTFGLIFGVTAVCFMVRSVLWHIEYKRLRYLFRHYLYALGIVLCVLLLADHIAEGNDSFGRVLMISPVLALGSVYLSGYRLRIRPDNASDDKSDK
jgi:hypothetical protein